MIFKGILMQRKPGLQNARQIGSSLADYPGDTLPILRKQVLYLDVPGRKLGSMGYFTYLSMGYIGVITHANHLLTSWDIQVI